MLKLSTLPSLSTPCKPLVPRGPSSCSPLTRQAHCKYGLVRRDLWAGGPSDDDVEEHKHREVITFFTADGIVQLPTRHIAVPNVQVQRKERLPLPTWEEQGLCIGATFWVAATNTCDFMRKINLVGFCRCIDMLSEVVEDAVLSRGGEIVLRKCKDASLTQSLKMQVAIPYLWGVPPEHETLSHAIESGGGIVHKVYRQWQLY